MENSMRQSERRWSRRRRVSSLCIIAASTCLVAFAMHSRAIQDPPPGAILRPWEPVDAVRIPNKNDQMQMQEQQQRQKKTNYEIANLERKKQISEDAAKLVELATDLKNEVDKSDKDQLSIGVIRKAEMIERLAKGVKEKMKLTAKSR